MKDVGGDARGLGMVSIVGGGPWDPELLTLAGQRRLERADVVIADYLANPALLVHCPAHVRVYQRTAGPRGYRPATEGPLPQPEIERLMIEHARAGDRVVRLKGGDPCMFGRGGEEAQALREAGIPYEMIPGVSAPIAAPETAGIPVTHRHFTPAVTFVSGWEAYEKAGQQVAWEHLAKSAGTLVLMMSIRNARANAERLIAAGRDASTPAAIVRWGTRGIQRTVVGTLGDIADRLEAAGLRPPAVLVVGEVVRLREQIEWFEQRPLFGRRIVVTRSAEQSSDLVMSLSAQGADVVVVPCLAVVPPPDPEAVVAAARDLASHDGLILSSPNGVRAFFDALDRADLDVRALATKTVAAIGSGTAAACRARGLIPDLVPDRARAEGLVDALRDRNLLTARWLHIRADEGRPLLGTTIESAGGRYTLVIGYRTIRPDLPRRLILSLRSPTHGGEGFDAILFASGRTARHFLQTLEDHLGPEEPHTLLSTTTVVSLGPVTTTAIESLGIKVHATAPTPTEPALLTTLHQALPKHPPS